jgi:hypothetical protein
MFGFEIEKMLLEKYHFPHNKRVTQVEDSPWRTSLLAGTLLADPQAGSPDTEHSRQVGTGYNSKNELELPCSSVIPDGNNMVLIPLRS